MLVNPAINTTITLVEGTTLSVGEFSSDDIVVYPNPTKGEIFVKNHNLSDTKVIIHNMNGQRVFNFKKEKNSINIKNLPTGTYILTLQQGIKLYQHKIIKE